MISSAECTVFLWYEKTLTLLSSTSSPAIRRRSLVATPVGHLFELHYARSSNTTYDHATEPDLERLNAAQSKHHSACRIHCISTQCKVAHHREPSENLETHDQMSQTSSRRNHSPFQTR